MPDNKTPMTLSGIWKVASVILGYLIMGVWITAQNSESNAAMQKEVEQIRIDMKDQIGELKSDIRYLSRRIDTQIANTKE